MRDGLTGGDFAESQEALEVSEIIMEALRDKNPSIGATVVAITSILVTIVAEFSQGNMEIGERGITALADDMKLNLRVLTGSVNLADAPSTLQ